MSDLTLAFIVLNAFLLGLGIAGLAFVRSALTQTTKATSDNLAKAEEIKVSCLSLTRTISEAHNGMAKRFIELEDKMKGWELRNPAKSAFSSMK